MTHPSSESRRIRIPALRRAALALFLSALAALPAPAQRIMEWNVENLFDTRHDSLKSDTEFTPDGTYRWTRGRYWHKLDNIARTIAAVAEYSGWPMMVGLCEVENDTVLRDLTRRTALWAAGYRYVMTDGPDERGVDVALLYRPESFRLLGWHATRVPGAIHGLRPTRDILVATGTVGRDTLHVCVVHMPSRRSNGRTARLLRHLAMQTLCHVADSLRGGKVIIMGDFNAEPGDTALSSLSRRMCTLLPTDRRTLRSRRGTYYFRGVWGFLDHIFVSPSLSGQAPRQARECRFPWLLRTSKEIPHRTYGGTAYLGGISDHLPLMVDLDMP